MAKARAAATAAGGSRDRDRRSRHSPRTAPTCSTPRNGARTTVLRRPRCGCAAARGTLRVVRARTLVHPGAAARPSSCTVCRCAAMSPSPTRSRWPARRGQARGLQSFGGADGSSASHAGLRHPELPEKYPMIMNRPDPSIAVRALKSAAPYIRMYKNKVFVIKAGGAVFSDEQLDARPDRAGRDPASGGHQDRAGAWRRTAARSSAGNDSASRRAWSTGAASPITDRST